MLNPATALFNTSKGKADGGSRDGLGASVWCCKQSQEKSTSQRVNGSALTKCGTSLSYRAGKVYKWTACFQSLSNKTNDKSQKVPNYSLAIIVNKLPLQSLPTSYISSLAASMPLHLSFEHAH